MMERNYCGLRTLYRSLDIKGKNPLRELHYELNIAVCKAYKFNPARDLLQQLIELSINLSQQEREGKTIIGPGRYPYRCQPEKKVCLRN